MSAPSKPEARRSTWARRLLGPLHFSSPLWYRYQLFIARFMPDWLKRPVIWICVRVGYASLSGVRRALGANHELVSGPLSWRERHRRALASLDTFAWCTTERYERFSPGVEFDVAFEGLEHWDEALAAQRGVILVTAHVGMWEAASRVPGRVVERTVHLVREREMDEGAQAFFEKLLAKDATTTYVTHFAEDPTLGIELWNALREGHLVALQGDRPRQGGRALEATLFGRPFALPEGPAALARASGAPLLPVFALREGRRRYRIRFTAPIRCARTAARDADHAAVASAMATAIEDAIRAAPEQWFRFF